MSKQRQMARKMREAQGQSHAVKIPYKVEVDVDPDGNPVYEERDREYVFRKLKRKRCHQVLHSLVAPFIQIVSTFIESVAIPLSDITSGKFDAERMTEELSSKVTITTDTLVRLVKTMPFDDYWALAQHIVDDVEIDGNQMGPLDDHEFFDDKPLELLKVIMKGIEVNYPFLKGLTKGKKGGSKGSEAGTTTTTTA